MKIIFGIDCEPLLRVRLEGAYGPDDVRKAITHVENDHGRKPDTIQVSPQAGMKDCVFCGIELTVVEAIDGR